MRPASTKIDPNAHIPAAVRRAAEQADAAFRQANGIVEVTPDAASAEPAPAPEPAPAEAPVAAATPSITPEVTPEVTPAPASEVNWEHRYKSMEGRYKRAENDIRAMSDQLASMQSLISTLQSQRPDDTSRELQPQSLLTPEEVNEYGSEFLGVVAKKAKEELSPEVAALKRELASIKAQVQGTQEVTSAQARRNLEATLDERIPHWRDINVAQEFHSWLALPDLYSGAIRHELLKAAYEQNNTPRVLAFFKGFLDQEAALAPASQGEPAPADATSSKIPLETFAAPGRAKTAAASAPAEKPTFTHAQISQFYAEATAGRFRGREAEKNRIEAQIFDAMREGRIR